jgi:uncharacterized YigZ family protein
MDSYLTIDAAASAELKIQNSRFLAGALPIADAAAFATQLEALRRQHYDATHHCFAWRLGMDGTQFRFSDDGEPSGTAGKRILGSIDRLQLTDVAVTVVRYFGGVKLGVGGLSKAYADAADLVLAQASIVRRYLMQRFVLRFPYDSTSQVHYAIERAGANILTREYLEHAQYTVEIRASLAGDLQRLLLDATNRTAVIEELPG